jgi:hypothetical protein
MPVFLRMFLTLACLAALLGADAARADEIIESTYTKHEYAKCREQKQEDDVHKHRCEGHVGTLVNAYLAEHSTIVDFGFQGDKDDQGQFPTGFVFAGDTVEWRGRVRTGKMTPYAAILRYDVGHNIGGPFKPVLYVYHIKGLQGSCIVGSIDGTHADANERARKLADEVSAGFRCGLDKPRPME